MVTGASSSLRAGSTARVRPEFFSRFSEHLHRGWAHVFSSILSPKREATVSTHSYQAHMLLLRSQSCIVTGAVGVSSLSAGTPRKRTGAIASEMLRSNT
jgi:hypothetical protein